MSITGLLTRQAVYIKQYEADTCHKNSNFLHSSYTVNIRVCLYVCVFVRTLKTLSTTSWIVPLAFPSCDIERRSVSMAWWLEHPSNDSPFTATSWSLTHNRPSCKTHNITTTISVHTFLWLSWQQWTPPKPNQNTSRLLLAASDFCTFSYASEYAVTLYAAPPCIMDLMKIPRSSPVSLDLFPLRLTPSPAEPLSLSGTSNISCSFPFSGT